jgi:hypothetical protein
MPKTSYTAFCFQCHDLVKRIHSFATESVHPKMLALPNDKSRCDVKRDVAIAITYLRILLWLRSLEKLDRTTDVQAVGAGARSILELFLDLKWFEKYPGPEWGERYSAFPNVDRYSAAQKAVEHKKNNHNSKIDPAPFQAFMDQLDAKQPTSSLVARVWDAKKKDGTPLWPSFHWTGAGNLSERARELGPACIDMYRQLYPVLSWLVHAGPTAFCSGSFADLEKYIGYAYFHTFLHAKDSTILACDLLGIRPHIDGFDASMEQFLEWQGDALATLPSA